MIIGGAGGIGEVWTEYMIQTYQAKIVWIGRRKKDTQIERKLKRLAALGPHRDISARMLPIMTLSNGRMTPL